jgi:hypothetical protein
VRLPESAQGRKGVFVEFVGVLVGEIGCCWIKAEEVFSDIMIWVLALLSRGETGLYRAVALLLAALVAVEVITVRGIGRGTPPETVGTGFTTFTGGWSTGLNPVEGAG